MTRTRCCQEAAATHIRDLSGCLPFMIFMSLTSSCSYSEELSRCQEEVRRLQSSLAAARDDCVSISDERLQLQQENLQLRKDMDELRKSTGLVQKKAKQQVTKVADRCRRLWWYVLA